MEAFLLRGLFLMCCILLVQSLAMKRSCQEYKNGGLNSGSFLLDLHDGLLPIVVYCDMDTAGGGWTVFQRRMDGSVDFYRDRYAYKQGFGHLQGEFWLGNDLIHRLTKSGLTTLRVDMQDWQSKTTYAQYDGFMVERGWTYELIVWGYTGTAGDSLARHNKMFFTTKDDDYDLLPEANCAVVSIGAWWYDRCHASNLNGKYYFGGEAPFGSGVIWMTWKGYYYSLKFVEMKLREPLLT